MRLFDWRRIVNFELVQDTELVIKWLPNSHIYFRCFFKELSMSGLFKSPLTKQRAFVPGVRTEWTPTLSYLVIRMICWNSSYALFVYMVLLMRFLYKWICWFLDTKELLDLYNNVSEIFNEWCGRFLKWVWVPYGIGTRGINNNEEKERVEVRWAITVIRLIWNFGIFSINQSV